MFLFVTATDIELAPLAKLGLPAGCATLVTGVGPVEATLSLTRYLAARPREVSAVVNFGLAGGYPESGLDLLDLCLAEREYFGDFGLVLAGGVVPLDPRFAPPGEFTSDPGLLALAARLLAEVGYSVRRGNFVTVGGGSGTLDRARQLRDRYQALCENMEGAALARVCQAFGVGFLEMRCLSNLAVAREDQVWRVPEAASLCAEALASIAGGLHDGR